ncbi:MAG: C4-dicarboxylate transport transcriptional regulatory protein [Myxococcaceae bacterium]|nr:C4-dicarboxylate transport transcriptional regulatory protein [Myxococcaceae bacterium]
MRASVLIVDDEKNILITLSRALKVEGYEVDVAGSGKLGLERAKAKSYDAILLDVQLPDIDGLEVLRQVKADREDVPVLVMSGHGTIDTAVVATRSGAHDFLEKPIGSERLLLSLSRAIDRGRLERENRELREREGTNAALLGDSPAMVELRRTVQLVAASTASVLITGERGTGKELVARAIHESSPRSKGPLEKLNCAAVPKELVESELFGHEVGAFSGASRQRKGKFERAHQGTLFLDEIGDMPVPMQAKLLRVLQEGEVERVGGSELLRVDVRVVAATNKDLVAAMRAGEFREDLFDRLNVLPLRMPRLSERKGDIALLAQRFVAQSGKNNDRPHKRLSDGALSLLLAYDYPGNVRELKNLIERLVILTAGDEISEREARALLPIAGGRDGSLEYVEGKTLRELLDDAERGLIRRALDHHLGNVTNTADALGVERSHLYKKMRALGLR